MSADKKRPLRSQAWFGRQDAMGFYYRSFLKSSGFPQDQFEGRPVIGICNTWSELTPCNAHFPNHRRTRKVGSPKPRSMGC